VSITDIYRNTVEQFRAYGIPEAENDTRLMMEHYFGVTRNDLLVHGDREAEGDASGYKQAIARRCNREPLQYILGQASFMGLDFEVNSDVLVPRADTEILVEEVLKDLHSGSRILDMCTGSGCILISLMNYSLDCQGVGVDLSEGALAVARKNAARLISGKDVRLIQSDLFSELAADEKFDILVSNPPYIASAEIEELMPEVRDFEPRMALDGTEDGLYFYRKIVEGADAYLKSGGLIAFEIGYDQGEAVKQLLVEREYREVEIIKDYSGMDRVVKGIKAFHL